MSRCYGCMKYGIIYVAFIFLVLKFLFLERVSFSVPTVTGVAIIALSTYLLAEQDTYLELAREDEYLRYGKWFLLVAGTTMLLGGILGCCGGIKQSSALLSLFFAIVLLISAAELAAGVYSYVHGDEFIEYFYSLMTNSVQNLYGRDEYITKAWDLIQKEMHCCGATGFRDYNHNTLQRQKLQISDMPDIIDMTLSAISPTSFMVPASCCEDILFSDCENARHIPITAGIPVIGNAFTSYSIYKKGCAGEFIEWMKTKTSYMIGALICIGSIQILCLLFTCVLICAFRARRSYKN